MLRIVKKSNTDPEYASFYANDRRPDTFVAYVRGKRCHSLKSLFSELSAVFRFPGYFGENWDALDECLCDLDWLCFDRIVVGIDDFHSILPHDPRGKQTLLSVLQTAIEYWEKKGVAFDVFIFD